MTVLTQWVTGSYFFCNMVMLFEVINAFLCFVCYICPHMDVKPYLHIYIIEILIGICILVQYTRNAFNQSCEKHTARADWLRGFLQVHRKPSVALDNNQSFKYNSRNWVGIELAPVRLTLHINTWKWELLCEKSAKLEKCQLLKAYI